MVEVDTFVMEQPALVDKKTLYEIYTLAVNDKLFQNYDSSQNWPRRADSRKQITKKTRLFFAIFVDFCPVRRSHWESCFPCGGSGLLNPGRNFAVFLAKCVFNFPKKKVPKFWARVNQRGEKSEVFRQCVNWRAEKNELVRQFFSRRCQPSVPFRNLMTVYRFPRGPSTPPHVFRQNPAFRDCVSLIWMVSFHQDRSRHADVQKLSANPRCGPCPTVKFCVCILQECLCRKDHLNCSRLLCHCAF